MTTSPEASLGPKDLAREMACAAAAIRRVLAPGLRPELEDLLEAFRAVQRVSEVRRSLEPAEPLIVDTDSVHAEAEYRAALADWERHLPRLHGWLLTERARLGSRSGHAHMVRAWVGTDRQTR